MDMDRVDDIAPRPPRPASDDAVDTRAWWRHSMARARYLAYRAAPGDEDAANDAFAAAVYLRALADADADAAARAVRAVNTDPDAHGIDIWDALADTGADPVALDALADAAEQESRQ